ncbi:MAG: hypothetical protein J5959_17435 [Butyrivibrio sp.]|nr:hypothetical protein [Butyrivibrio sp.]
MDKLREALEKVPGSYDDFVDFIIEKVDDNEEASEKVIDFINENSEARTSQVLDYFDEVREEYDLD